MRSRLLSLALLIAAAGFPANAAPLIGGPKTISLDADGNIPGVVVSTQMGMGYVKGAKQVAVNDARDVELRDPRAARQLVEQLGERGPEPVRADAVGADRVRR